MESGHYILILYIHLIYFSHTINIEGIFLVRATCNNFCLILTCRANLSHSQVDFLSNANTVALSKHLLERFDMSTVNSGSEQWQIGAGWKEDLGNPAMF